MATFTDIEGRSWRVAITHGHWKKVKCELGVDLYALGDDKLKGLMELLDSPDQLVAVVFCLIEKQATDKDLSPEDFALGLDGATMEAMGEAFLAALGDFFPNPQARKALGELLKKGKAAMEILDRRLTAKLENLTPEKLIEHFEARNGAAPTPSEPSTV
jgi:hypothetical protein